LVVSRQSTDPKKGKDTHTMSKDNVFELKKPEPIVVDQLTEILRQGARKLLAQALEAEIEQGGYPFNASAPYILWNDKYTMKY
jgi:hypothetical protein